MAQLIVFGLGSMALLIISRKSLRDPSSHGFYRFFAWECILGLLVLNVPLWYQDPFSWHQLISWILLISSLVSLILGVRTLRGSGKPDQSQRVDNHLFGFEKTTALVTSGIYRYLRHPLYSSLFLLNWGVFFKDPALLQLSLALAATFFLVATAKADERECMQVFGPEYEDYMLRTKMFIPFIF